LDAMVACGWRADVVSACSLGRFYLSVPGTHSLGSCVGAKAHLKLCEERFTKKIILKVCHMRGRYIKDNPVSSEIEVGMEVKIDAFQASVSVGDE